MNLCKTCGRETENPKFCSMACIRGKFTIPHTEATKRRISKAKDGRIGFTNDLGDNGEGKLSRLLERLDGVNKKHIIRFYRQCVGNNLKPTGINRYINDLITMSGILNKDFKRATTNDIIDLIYNIENNGYSDGGKNHMKGTLKKFFSWLYEREKPPQTAWIRIKKPNHRKLPEDMLSVADVKEIISVCRNKRERSAIAMLFWMGVRASELCGIRIRDISFDDRGAVIMIHGSKTATSERRIRVCSGLDLLRAYLGEHPDPRPENLVWQMCYWSLRNLLRKLERRLIKQGFTKHLHAHKFRASLASYFASQGMNSYQLMQHFGWSKVETSLWYVSLSGRDVDNAICALPKMVF